MKKSYKYYRIIVGEDKKNQTCYRLVRGNVDPFLLRQTQEIDCQSGVGALPYKSDYSSYATHTLSGRWPRTNLEPFDYKVNTQPAEEAGH